MKTSVRNLLEGTVREVKTGQVAAVIKVELNKPATITSMITEESVRDLDIKPGDQVKVMIKATSVMIVKEQ
jgi:molybdopterin-binding protein